MIAVTAVPPVSAPGQRAMVPSDLIPVHSIVTTVGSLLVEYHLDHHNWLHRGLIARFVSPGPNGPSGFILTTVLGIVGAFVATFIGQTIGWYQLDQGAGLIGATVGALIVLFIWNRLVVHHVIGDPGAGPQGRRP